MREGSGELAGKGWGTGLVSATLLQNKILCSGKFMALQDCVKCRLVSLLKR